MIFYVRLAITSLRSLESHFLRSLLATVGVLIGVGSVVACMSILEGATNRVMRNFRSLGSNLIFVTPATARVEGRIVGRAQTLRLDDIKTITEELGIRLDAAAPQALGNAPIKHLQKTESFTLIATSDRYFEMNGFEAGAGRVLNAAESNDDSANVVVLGWKVADELFGGMEPLGAAIKIRNTPYRVIGVMEKRGNVGFLDADKAVFIPIRAGLKRFFNQAHLDFITLSVAKDQDIDAVKKDVERILRKEHNIRPGQADDFEVDTLEETVQNFNQFAVIFRVVFYSIAGISLVVGGIGIMNIMLVSVTERTREIGVRMACGARRWDILLQFLVESLVISLLGGGFGLLLGMMFADLLDKVLAGIFNTEITATVVITALVTTTLVGVASGLYPAYKASRLDPVEALRYE